MSTLRRIVNNTLISLIGQTVTWSSTLLLTIAYGRFLGDVKFGELYFAISFVALVGFPIELGFNQQITRDVAQDPEKASAYLWNALLIKVTLWVLLYAAILFAAWALGYNQEQRSLVAICGIILVSASIVNIFTALHYAFERTLFPAVGLILEKGLAACIGFILLKNGATVQTMAFVLLGGSLIDAIWVALWFFRLVGWHVVINKAIIHKLLHTSIPFILYGVLGVIYYRIDTVMLSLMAGSAVVGWYGAAYRLFDTLLFIPNLILSAIMYPVFSKLSVSSKSTLKMAVEKCMNLLLICAIPIATLMIVAAPNIIGFLYHQADFANAMPVLQALAPGLVFLYINMLFGNIIVSTRGEKKIPITAGIALVFNLGLNLVLIPIYRHIGAALVTSFTELLLLCISALFVPKYLLPRRSLKVGGKVLVATLFMAVAAFLLRTSSILIIAPVALVVYGATATLLGAIPREDMQMLYRSIRSKGERSSTEFQTNVVDENVFDRTTQPLPAMTVRRVHPELTIEPELAIESEFASESDATTAYLPSVMNDTTVPLPSMVNVTTVPLPSIVNDIRARLPTVRARSIKPKVKIRKVRIQPEVVEE